MPVSPINIPALKKNLALCGGEEAHKQAVLRFCTDDRHAMEDVPSDWLLFDCTIEVDIDIKTMTAYYKKKEVDQNLEASRKAHRKAEPKRNDKLSIIRLFEHYYKVIDEMQLAGITDVNNALIKKCGNKEIIAGAILVMAKNNYYKDSMNGKKVKLIDIINFSKEYFQCSDLQYLWHSEERKEYYMEKARATLSTLTTNEQKH